MALVPLSDRYAQRFNTTTKAIHLVSIDYDGTETDLGAIVQAAANALLTTMDADTSTMAALVTPLAVSLSGTAGDNAYGAAIGPVTLSGQYSELLVEVANGGAATEDLTNFKIQRQPHGTANFMDWLEGTDFATPTDTLRESLTDSADGGLYVNALPDGTHCQLRLNLRGAYAVRFYAQAGAGDTPAVTIKGYAGVR